MNKRLSKQDKLILDNLDRMIASQQTAPASSFLEEKILQALKTFEYAKEKRVSEQQNTARLMSDLSHQIKTPLSALLIHLDLANDDALSASERETSLAECKKLGEKINFLTESLFKAARLESGLIAVQPINADIIPTLFAAIAAVKPSAQGKGLTLILNLPETLVVAHDPIWTKEAIQNIMDNAIKYTEIGSITLSINIGAIYTCLTITDTGIGIQKEDYTKIFERFYRVRQTGTERVEGTGLGLSISREIMRQQGGNITVSSGNTGSTFSLFLQNR